MSHENTLGFIALIALGIVPLSSNWIVTGMAIAISFLAVYKMACPETDAELQAKEDARS